MKPTLVVVELWGLGDLAIGTPFIQAATRKYEVTLIAKPYARDLACRFFPSVNVKVFEAPWTAFRRKYRLWEWPWRELLNLRPAIPFDFGVSTRCDPRDHLVLRWVGAHRRLGFPRVGSQVLLTDALPRPSPVAHRYEYWRALALGLGLELPLREHLAPSGGKRGSRVVVHTGAAQKLRVWPLERYRDLVLDLRQAGYSVQVVCDSDQKTWWQSSGETEVTAPASVSHLSSILQNAGAFIGNDSGPGHLAALLDVPTFTLFGPQLSQWFAPLHPVAEWLDGSPCPFKPCFDSCHFPSPYCLLALDAKLVCGKVRTFLSKHI